jgi:hypothetical protein
MIHANRRTYDPTPERLKAISGSQEEVNAITLHLRNNRLLFPPLTGDFMKHKCITSILLLISLAVALSSGAVPAPTETILITSAPPHTATGELFILKADTNTVALHNPVLVVEGFDIGNSMNWPELYDLLNQENLVADLQSFGRDLLVLNFTDSTIDILENTALNEAAIAYINTNRADVTDKFTAVGASLGELTLRKALVDMPAHDIDTWISFDAPHEGANIPLGVQEYLEFFASENVSAADLLAILDRPAARQMLLTHHSVPDGLTGGSTPERLDYTTLMDYTGYPTNCKGVAVSNGSGYGDKLPFYPGDLIMHWTDSGGLFDPDITADVFAVPQSPSTVFSGLITVFFIPYKSATVNSYHPLSFDNAPGGTRSTFLQLFTNIPPDQISGDDYLTATNHCFIPTVSALGIPIENLESNLAANASLPAMSPFDEIHYATNNEEHVEINARNKRWIMRAVLEEHDTDGDGFDDYQEFLVGTDYSSASSLLDIVADISVLTGGVIQLSWDTYPNTQYEVWYTPVLGDPWFFVEDLPPTTNTSVLRSYPVGTNAAGFFSLTGEVIDPVTD